MKPSLLLTLAASATYVAASSVLNGLRNLGGSCYMNTALQSLDAVGEARGILLSVDSSAHAEPVYRDALLGLQTILYGLRAQNATFTNDYLRGFLRTFAAAIEKSEGSRWDTARQMDEGEFFVKMLATVKSLLVPFPEKLARFKEIFESYEAHHIDSNASTFTPSVALYLPGISPNVVSFETALTAYTAEESVSRTVDGVPRNSKKRIWLGCVSPVFSTYITRFDGPDAQKNAKRISFPTSVNIGPYMIANPPFSGPQSCMMKANNATAVNMELFFIVMHHGETVARGHYIGFLKTGDRWIRFDDSDVQEVVEADAIERLFEGNDTAMMLHYVRTDAKDTVLNQNFALSPAIKAKLDAEIANATSAESSTSSSSIVIPDAGAPSTPPASAPAKKRSFWDIFRWAKSPESAANSQAALSITVLLGVLALLSLCVV